MNRRRDLVAGFFVTLACLLLLSASAQAQEGEPEGGRALEVMVRFEGDFSALRAFASDSAVWRVPMIPLDVARTPPPERLVAALVQDGAPRPTQARVEVGAYRIRPSALVLAPGSSLTFIGRGPGPWQVRAVDRPELPPIDLKADGERAQVELARPGRYLFLDANYPSVSAYVIVASSVAYATPVESGPARLSFHFGGLEVPGPYKLRVYFDGRLIHEREIADVEEGVPVEFLLGVGDLLSSGS